MKIASNICCSLDPYYYCKNCKYKLCIECCKNLSERPRLEAKWGKLAKVMLDHSHHSLCIKRDIVYYGNVYK